MLAAFRAVRPAPAPNPRTNRTRRVPHPVLIGHAASLTPYASTPRPSPRPAPAPRLPFPLRIPLPYRGGLRPMLRADCLPLPLPAVDFPRRAVTGR